MIQKHVGLICLLAAAQSMAGGYEKNIIFSGKQAGVAGAGVSSVEGSQSLLFNPAGLAAGEGSDLSLHFSPTFSQFKAPLFTAGEQSESKRKFSPVFGLTSSYRVMPKLSIAAGYYVVGGSAASYGEQDLTDNGFTAVKPDFSSNVTITELAVGAGYEFAPGFRFGAAWRANFVKANYNTGFVSSTSALSVKYSDLSDTTFKGVRLGFQWEPEDMPFGLGINWRSNIKFKAEGNINGELETVASPGTKSTLVGSKASFENNFPQQVAIGGHYDVTDDLRLFSEYVWSEYSRNQRIVATGSLATSTGTTVANSSGIEQNWKNQHNVRVAAQYTGWDWALRGGYVYTSQVTDSQRPKPTFSVPAVAHTVALGTGSKFMDDKLSFDAAFEYSFASGTTDESQNTVANGKYSNNAYAIHTTVGYLF